MSDWIIERYASEVAEEDNKELASLKEKVNKLQEQYDKAIKKQYHNDYLIENQKKQIEGIGKTLSLYERENKAMRELLSIWV